MTIISEGNQVIAVEASGTPERAVTRSSGKQTRERLRVLALELFWEKGYRATSTRDLATRLGVKQASLYYHLKSKDELLYDICYSSLLHVIEVVKKSAHGASNPLEALRQVTYAHSKTALELQKQFLVSMSDYRSLSSDCLLQFNIFWSDYEQFVGKMFEAGIRSGMVRDDISNKYHFHFVMSMINWATLWFRPQRELTIEEVARIFSTIHINGAAEKDFSRQHGPKSARMNPEAIVLPAFERIDVARNATHSRLLDTASTLFSRNGYTTTSLREIAAAMEIEKASLYYYVIGKEDLCYQITKAAHEHLISGVKSALERPSNPAERLYTLIAAHVVCLLQHRDWHATANEQIDTLSANLRDEIVAMRDEYERLVQQTIREAQDTGIARADIDAKYLTLALLGVITHIYPWYQPEIDIPPFELGMLLADMFVYGIAARS